MVRAVEIVRPPKLIVPTPFPPNVARTRTDEARDSDLMQPPWLIEGYVSAHGELGFHPSRAVWWDSETDHVWLKCDGP